MCLKRKFPIFKTNYKACDCLPPWQCFIALNTSLVDFASPWDGSEHVPVLGSDTDRHHYTFSCFHSPSMKCHSVFSVLLLCLGCALSVVLHFSFSHFARSLSFTLHFPPICFHLTALSFSTSLFLYSLSLSPFPIPPFPIPLSVLYLLLP